MWREKVRRMETHFVTRGKISGQIALLRVASRHAESPPEIEVASH